MFEHFLKYVEVEKKIKNKEGYIDCLIQIKLVIGVV